jgi:lipoprotein-anchoring transpeptidase ErfK/SrfK
VKRLVAIGLFALGFAVAGVFSGAVIADVTTSTATSTTATTTTTTTVPTTTTAPTTTTLPTTTVTHPSAGTIPAGVRVAGVRVGGLKAVDAVSAVKLAFQRPLPIVVDRNRLELNPLQFASGYATTAVARARVAAPGANVSLVVAVHGASLRAWVAKLEQRFRRAAVDASLTFPNAHPRIREDRPGRDLDAKRLTARIITALRANSRLPVRVHTRSITPAVTAAAFKDSIVINRSANRLYLYDGTKLKRTFAVATGQSIYPTPRGRWQIVVKWKNPWWYPPVQDDWAKGLKPVPPGPSNPLGTRWMGLNAPGVGIHGTDEPGSIGYSASHGCIRMQVPDAEWLFNQVDVGTTVYIV